MAVTFDHLLTVPEVAEKLRVKPETVRRWLRSGALRGRQMGGRRGGYRIATSEVDRFFREKSDGHAPEGA